jgi:hypothetical protein
MTMTEVWMLAASVAVVVTGALILWSYLSKAAAVAWRRKRMMARVGLDPELAERGGPRTRLVMKGTAARCAECTSVRLCERWLAGQVEGDNVFCPNSKTFDTIREKEQLSRRVTGPATDLQAALRPRDALGGQPI